MAEEKGEEKKVRGNGKKCRTWGFERPNSHRYFKRERMTEDQSLKVRRSRRLGRMEERKRGKKQMKLEKKAFLDSW